MINKQTPMFVDSIASIEPNVSIMKNKHMV